ncbi:MAG: DUF3617 domain-containing protein [Sphingomonas sp.]|nr:DUF3617 domain-containing protein [Sphingomonas sp.]
MNRAALLIALALPLAACGGPTVSEENASVAEVTERVREASGDEGLIRPGKWVSNVSVEQMEMPGMPPQAAEQMKRMIAQTHTSEACLTPEEVKEPKAGFFGGNENCRYDHFTMRRGKIDAKMRCEAGGASQIMEMTGTYSPEAYEMRMKATSEGGSASQGMTMQMKVDAKRTGECTADAA